MRSSGFARVALFDEIVFIAQFSGYPDYVGETLGVGVFVDWARKCVPTSVNPDHPDG